MISVDIISKGIIRKKYYIQITDSDINKIDYIHDDGTPIPKVFKMKTYQDLEKYLHMEYYMIARDNGAKLKFNPINNELKSIIYFHNKQDAIKTKDIVENIILLNKLEGRS